MVENKLEDLHDVLFDGFPRTINQANKLKEFLEKRNEKIDLVIDLNVPDRDILIRTLSRIICSNKKCKASYNTVFMPPKVEGICDYCGSKLVKRPDDNAETIKHRLEIYHNETEPLINYYKQENILKEIDIDIYKTTREEITNFAIEALNQ